MHKGVLISLHWSLSLVRPFDIVLSLATRCNQPMPASIATIAAKSLSTSAHAHNPQDHIFAVATSRRCSSPFRVIEAPSASWGLTSWRQTCASTHLRPSSSLPCRTLALWLPVSPHAASLCARTASSCVALNMHVLLRHARQGCHSALARALERASPGRQAVGS